MQDMLPCPVSDRYGPHKGLVRAHESQAKRISWGKRKKRLEDGEYPLAGTGHLQGVSDVVRVGRFELPRSPNRT